MFTYNLGKHTWLPLSDNLLPIGGQLLSRISFTVGFPLSYLVILLGCILVRTCLVRYISGISHSYILILLLPLILGTLGLGTYNFLPPLVALLFLVLALVLLIHSAQTPHILSRVFLISVLIGASSLFYLPAFFFFFVPILFLLHRYALSIRGVLLIVAGVALTGATVFFICWLIAVDAMRYYPITAAVGILPLSDLLLLVRFRSVNLFYFLFLFLLWLPLFYRMHAPNNVHRTSYLLISNIFISIFLVSLLALFFVREPYYMLPFLFSSLGAMLSYTLAYSSGKLANFFFFLVLASSFVLYVV